MDKIILNNMAFYAFHGAMEEEKSLGQRFFIDAILFAELKRAGQTDDLHNTLNYGIIYDKIKEIVENERFNLIEALAHRICLKLLEDFPRLHKIQLTIRKPAAPVGGIFDYMAVELTRTREDLA